MGVPQSDRSAWPLLLAAAFLALAVYAPTLRGTFVYDDRDLIVQNPWVHELSDLPSAFTRPMWSFRTSAPTNYYRPLPVAVYTLLWVAGGGTPWPFHLLNVLLHAGNAVLVAALVLRLTRERALALGAGCLFAVHPLATEAVAWISGLPELLYAAALLGFLHLHLSGKTVLAAGVLLLGLLSKETAFAGVPLVFLVEWSRERKIGPALRRVLPYLIPVALALGLRLAALGGLAPQAGGPTEWGRGVLLAPKVLATYLGLLVAPFGLSAHHALHAWKSPQVVLGVVAAAGLLLLLRRRPGTATAVGLSLLPLLPVLYVPVLGTSPIAERYAYLSIAGMAWAGCEVLRHRPRLLATAAGVLVLAGVAVSFSRTSVWHDERALAEAMIREDPRAKPAYLMLAKWHWDLGDKEAAVEVFRHGLAQLPDDAELAASLVVARWSKGGVPPSEAIPALEALVQTRPGDAMLLYNLGEAYLRTERAMEAEASFARALAARPACAECLVGQAVVASKRGDHRAAADLARQALALAPGDVAAQRQLGVSLLRLGETAEALDVLGQASLADPENAEVWNALGAAYATGGRLEEAERAWARAVELDPGQENARRNLERMRALQGAAP